MFKETFIYLYKLNFNNKKFKIFWSTHTGCFPIEIIGDKLAYPEYDDYIEIYKKLETTSFSDISVHFLADSGSDFLNSLKSNAQLKIKQYVFQPLVRTFAIGLISFSLALSMSGCTVSGISTENSNGHSIEQVDEKVDEKINEIIEKAKENNIELKYNENLEKFFVEKYYDKGIDKNVVIVDSLNDLKQYLPEANQNPSFEDIHNTIDNNPNIKDDIKLKFHEIANNIEKNQPNLNLFLLNYNLERMTVNMSQDKEYVEGESAGTLASFNPITGQMDLYYNNLSLLSYGHELGHAAFSLTLELDDNTQISYNPYPVVYEPFYKIINIENGSDEGLAELFSLVCCDKTQFDTDKNNSYVPMTEGMNLILNSIGWKLEDISNRNYTELLEEMHKHGIKDPIATIVKLSKIYASYKDGKEYDDKAYDFGDWAFDYGVEIGEYEIKNEKEYNPEKTENLYKYSAYNGIVSVYILKSDGTRTTVDVYNKDATKEDVKDALSKLNKEYNGNIIEKVENIFDRDD